MAADFTTSLITTDLAASTTDFKNSIVFSAGCHSGYNIVDADILQGVTLPLDWAQAFARKQATLIAGTGYQYGDTDFIEYSERLYLNFAKQLRAAASGPVAVGEALVKAKLQYLATTPDIRGIHQKALLEATLFGLPMLGVNMPSGRTTINPIAPAITPVAVATGTGGVPLHLMTTDVTVTPTLTPHDVTLDTVPAPVPPSTAPAQYVANYLSGPDGVTTNPVEPVLPLVAVNVTPNTSGVVLRGVGFRGGSYVDSTPVLPLTGAPVTEIRGVHVQFLTPQFFPMRMWTPNHFPALGGASRDQPARHARAAPGGGRRAWHHHAARVHEPQPAPVLQRRSESGGVVRCAGDRQRRRPVRRYRRELRRAGGRRPGAPRCRRSGSPTPTAAGPGPH